MIEHRQRTRQTVAELMKTALMLNEPGHLLFWYRQLHMTSCFGQNRQRFRRATVIKRMEEGTNTTIRRTSLLAIVSSSLVETVTMGVLFTSLRAQPATVDFYEVCQKDPCVRPLVFLGVGVFMS